MTTQPAKSGVPDPLPLRVALLTGGDDRSYALGLTAALVNQGIAVDFIGSDALDAPQLHQSPLIQFLNLRGDQSRGAPLLRKIGRISTYYLRLIRYAATAEPRVFHILWNNKFEYVDRVLLMLFYRALGKQVVLTAHNVNAGKRDGKDTFLNRLTLRIQYHLCRQIFVHTPRMKANLESDFGLAPDRVSVIPFGINNTTPRTGLTRQEARARFGLAEGDKTLLFFGQIAPYKGLEFLVEAIKLLTDKGEDIRLVIGGKVKAGCEEYWVKIQRTLGEARLSRQVIQHIRFIPDSDVEIYMMAADAVAIPYVQIFQSGVPFLAYSFGVPVIATDVGSLRDDIIEGRTGYLCRPCDPQELAETIGCYFASDMYRALERTRRFITSYANERHSWELTANTTRIVYQALLPHGIYQLLNKTNAPHTADD